MADGIQQRSGGSVKLTLYLVLAQEIGQAEMLERVTDASRVPSEETREVEKLDFGIITSSMHSAVTRSQDEGTERAQIPIEAKKMRSGSGGRTRLRQRSMVLRLRTWELQTVTFLAWDVEEVREMSMPTSHVLL